MEYNYTTTGSTALRASMQIFTDETYTEAYLGLFEILKTEILDLDIDSISPSMSSKSKFCHQY